MTEYSIIGKPTRNVDGPEKVTGRAQYAFDMTLPGMLYAKILRSLYPHAKILNIDTSQAEKLPGVKGVITGKDTLGINFGVWRRFPELKDEQPLAIDKVRYIGDPVAAVAATDEYIAEEALDLIEVEYEPLPAVFDPLEAMQDDAPLVHDSVENNISVTRHIEWGDVDEAFKNADYIREDRYTVPPQSHTPLEVHNTLASFDNSSGRLTVWTSTQTPYYVQLMLADTLEMREGNIRIIKPHVGGGFGGKIGIYTNDYVAARLSIKTGRPVKLVYSREEEFTCTWRRTPMYYNVKMGAKKDGTIVAKEVKVITDGGAYHGLGATTLYLTGFFSAFPYKIPNYRFDGYRVYTNKSIAASMRGFGGPQAVFTGEQSLDMVAHDLGIDPIEIRRRNAMTPHYVVPGQATIESCGLLECLDEIEKSIKKRGKLPKDRGIGIAAYGYMSGGIFNWIDTPYAFSSAMIRISVDGMVDLYTQAAELGQGSNTTLAMICAEELGVHLEDIRVHSGDTGIAPSDLGAWGSRTTLMMGNAVKMAAADAKRQLFEFAAAKLTPNIVYNLDAKDRRIFNKIRPERGVSYYDVVKDAIRGKDGEVIIGRGHYTPHEKGMISPAYSFGVQSAEVEVDRETGKAKIVKVVTVHDCGQVINPLGLRGQLEGSIMMAAGYGFTEDMPTDEGKVLNPSLADYKLLRYIDMPDTEVLGINTYEPEGPFGAKEAGEGLTCPTAGALGNAIYNAVGIRMKDAPLTPERILKALKEKEKAEK
ncbi:4-hydroxybenzoyl-CoA reductase subunit alpha [subsurface metagenome]